MTVAISQPLQNLDSNIWAVLTAISNHARKRHQGINMLLVAEEHVIDAAFTFVYREAARSTFLKEGSVAKRKVEEFAFNSKRLKGIGIGAPEGPLSLDDFKSLQRSNKELRKQLESQDLVIDTLRNENRENVEHHEKFITPRFKYTPNAILAAIIISAVIGLINIPATILIWKIDKLDFVACMGAFFGVVFISVEMGLLIAVAISFAKILLQVTRPRTAILGKILALPIYLDKLVNQYLAIILSVTFVLAFGEGLMLLVAF
ncbi:hypothetical protein ACFE04_006003 [Oxalis oulophora]